MDNAILKKKLKTFKTAKGTLKRVSNEVVFEVLKAWENWQGKTTDLCRELGISRSQVATMIQQAKRLLKEGAIKESEFKEITQETSSLVANPGVPCGIEIAWDQGKLIRFTQVEQLVEFLKKVA